MGRYDPGECVPQRSKRIWNAHRGPRGSINGQKMIISSVLENDIIVWSSAIAFQRSLYTKVMDGHSASQTRKNSKIKVKVTHVTTARVTHDTTIHPYNDDMASFW
jgi:hypothetical protein